MRFYYLIYERREGAPSCACSELPYRVMVLCASSRWCDLLSSLPAIVVKKRSENTLDFKERNETIPDCGSSKEKGRERHARLSLKEDGFYYS
ncbi:hypothetical protein SLEP1_g59525 [Rubroshorea leprosula]|uniref:Uncharacterized protein n=1 Tax=Rubroshorea leprosula TaxID=152421 RepID=A0AAV5MT30_9ROSI|nr:hypothetical protein SLEP1_g59525 [Rubroshorea leprosula]